MAARVTPQVTTRNFHELTRCVKGRAKVLLTCRTHYFKSRTEEEEIVLGGGQDLGTETARDLYFELISRKGFRIAYLRPFEVPQIEEYVKKVRPDTAKRDLTKIRATYNLMESFPKAYAPLEMIVKSIDKLSAGEINPATLYTIYTDAWIHRDKWRDVLSPNAKLAFLMALANCLWQEDLLRIHHTRLLEYVELELATQIQNPQQLIEVDNEIRTASFLTRDQLGYYGFAHKSYSEFFIARYLSLKLAEGDLSGFQTRRLTPEVVGFLGYLINVKQLETLLERALCEPYRPLISENILICLYGLRRGIIIGIQDASETSMPLRVPLPSKMQLSGAQLDQVTLEGADLTGADLRNANLAQAILTGANMTKAQLSGADLEKTDLRRTCMRAVDAASARLMGVNLEAADLSDADFSDANLTDAYLLNVRHEHTSFERASFTRAILPDSLKPKANQDVTSREKILQIAFDGARSAEDVEDGIKELYKIARIYARRYGAATENDYEDIAQDAVLAVMRGDGMAKWMAMGKEARRRYALVMVSRSQFRRTASKEVRFSEVDVEAIPSPEVSPGARSAHFSSVAAVEYKAVCRS